MLNKRIIKVLEWDSFSIKTNEIIDKINENSDRIEVLEKKLEELKHDRIKSN